MMRLIVFYSTLSLLSVFGEGAAQGPDGAGPSPKPIPSWTGCPVNGPLLPKPTGLAESKHVKTATQNLTRVLDDAVAGKIKAGWDVANTSFSLAFVSPHGGEAKDGTLWEYHHRGEANVNGTKKVDGDSQYLIGSVSKLFSEILLLDSNLNLEDPITKFLPELKNDTSPIRWNNITLAAMSEHLSGVPPNTVGAFDFFALGPLYEQIGFPHLEEGDYYKCGIEDLNGACNQEDLLQSMQAIHPVAEPYSRPVYSQLSFNLFTLALNASTGRNYSQMLNEKIISPLSLNNTGVSPGETERAVIPSIERQGWGADYGFNAPGGGLYSSLNDLSCLMTSVLDHTILETPQKVRQWLQPHSITSSLSTLVGQPWEIQRTTDLTPDHPHTIDIYAKSGGANGYLSHFSVIDEYGVGFVLLTAGPPGADKIINEAMVGSILPAVEEEARNQAKAYVANYSSMGKTLVSMRISMDDGTGLKLDSLSRNGSDILTAIETVWSYSLSSFGILNTDFRLYPAGVESPAPGHLNPAVVQQDWRINFDIVPTDTATLSGLPAQGKLNDICGSWQSVDWLQYGGQSLDRVIFTVDKSKGEVLGVEIPFLRSGLLNKVTKDT